MNINQIQAMKVTGEKSAALVVWDAPTAHIAHECGADFLIVGDSVGVNLWGHSNNLEITLDDFLVAVKAVRRAQSHCPAHARDSPRGPGPGPGAATQPWRCLLYTSDAADD